MCLCAVLLLSACTGEDKPSPAASPSGSPTLIATAKPKVTVPKGPAPTELVKKDLIVGTGAAAFPGQVVTVHYVGLYYETGKEFESSWDSGHTFPFRLGDGRVIEGWDKGLLGMRVGGRRQLVIPPDLAYGEAGTGHELGGQTLVFVIDLISVGGQVGPGEEDVQPTA